MRSQITNRKITQREYTMLQRAYDMFNDQLFDGVLPDCLITLRSYPNSKGFFVADQFAGRKSDEKICEIALNPDSFGISSDEEILSNLLHEMAHAWNHYYGIPTKPGYHSKAWSKKMLEVGLNPISYDKNSKNTGYRVDHEIIDGGQFQKLAHQLLNTGVQFSWQSVKTSKKADEPEPILCAEKKENSKTGFSCPECLQKAWAKSSANLLCGICNKRMLTKAELLELNTHKAE
jgi:predicted SprT family Zn-dependent metalloprotease